MKSVLRLFLLLPFFCAAENLFPEWDKECGTDAVKALPEWRISSWGAPEKPLTQWKGSDGRPALFLKTVSEQGTCAMIRTLPLTAGKKRTFRFSATLRGAKPALVQLLLSGAHDGRRIYCNTSPEQQIFSVELTFPAQVKQLLAAVYQAGKGETEISGVRLDELPENEKVQLFSNLFGRSFEIGENVPGCAVVNGSRLPRDSEVKIKLLLPRGFRLSSNSWNSRFLDAVPLPDGASEYSLSTKCYAASFRVMLLLESLLPPSQETARGKIEISWNGGSESRELSFRTVPAVRATPPRSFSAGLFWSQNLDPDEARERLNTAMLFSGANFLCGGYNDSPAKIRRFAELVTPQPLRSGLCKYAEIRSESFWEKRLNPLQRYVNIQSAEVIAAADLGQKNGIYCLCPLCRAEFADFAPKLPPRRIMNLSAGQLQRYYGKQLQAFRTARWQSLIDAAPHHLLAGRKPFARKPRFRWLFNALDLTPEIAGLKKIPRAAVRMPALSALLPDQEFPQDLTLFLIAEESRRRFPKADLIALLPSAPKDSLYSDQHSEFLLTAFFAAGFNGFCADLQQDADYRNLAGFSFAVKKLQPYERWQKTAPEKSGVTVECSAEKAVLPVLPATGKTIFPLPPEHATVVTAFRRQGKELLVMVGNFGFATQKCTLKAPGYTPAERTVDAAPRHWEFVTFRAR